MNTAPFFDHIIVDEPPPSLDQLDPNHLDQLFLSSDMTYSPIQHFPSQSPQEIYKHNLAFSGQHIGQPSIVASSGEAHLCPHCGKVYERLCDLNKHAKTHIRPYKCSYADCRYHTVGWPTEKELERHMNDKHLDNPQTFSCQYAGCTYSAKRESNCKQHMEKTHGWEYRRSRQMKQYQCPIPNCVSCASPEESQQNHASTPIIALPPGHHDFPLFPDSRSTGMYSAQHPGLGYVQTQQQGSATASTSILPWDSPASRERMTDQALRGFDASFQQSMVSSSQVPVDPQLIQTPTGSRPTNLVNSRLFPEDVKQTRSPSTLSPMDNDSRWTNSPNYTTSATRSSSLNVPIVASAASSQSTVPRTLQRLKREPEPDEEYDDDDACSEAHPGKRTKVLADDDFEDNAMPCPFRLHNAALFDRNTKEKFSPCHTKHKDISTIVRHLGRPAHMLSVEDLAISSFDMAEDGHLYPRVGLCRRCWKSFRDQDEFTEHLAKPCTKVSKGKREKFWLLYHTFCAQPVDGPERPSSAGMSGHPTPSPAVHETADAGATVSMTEHLNLVVRVRELEEDNKRLWSALSMLPPQQQMAVSLRQAPPVRIAEPSLRRRPADRESLVGGMNSRPIDVDRDGLISEVQHTASGLPSSTDRSSVLHVPPSPGFDELRRRMVAEQERRTQSPGNDGSSMAKQQGPSSIADSAYFANADKERGRGGQQQQLVAGEGRELSRMAEQDERGQPARTVSGETYEEEMEKMMFGGLNESTWS